MSTDWATQLTSRETSLCRAWPLETQSRRNVGFSNLNDTENGYDETCQDRLLLRNRENSWFTHDQPSLTWPFSGISCCTRVVLHVSSMVYSAAFWKKGRYLFFSSQSHVTAVSECLGVEPHLTLITAWQLPCSRCWAPSLTRGHLCHLSVIVLSISHLHVL